MGKFVVSIKLLSYYCKVCGFVAVVASHHLLYRKRVSKRVPYRIPKGIAPLKKSTDVTTACESSFGAVAPYSAKVCRGVPYSSSCDERRNTLSTLLKARHKKSYYHSILHGKNDRIPRLGSALLRAASAGRRHS
jgi:hypothetical protein